MQPTKLVSVRTALTALVAPSAVVALGCTTPPDYSADEDSGSTHVLVAVDRSEQAAGAPGDGEPAAAEQPEGELAESERADTEPLADAPTAPQLVARANALAGFVRVPATVDSTTAMQLLGLELELPEVGQCAVHNAEHESSPGLSPVDRIELLEAGNVSVHTSQHETTLAPRAFPTVTDLVEGVVYTTRDLSAEPLPAGESYTVRAAGSEAIVPLSVSVQAPPVPSAVTVGGVPIHGLSAISARQPIDVTWKVGEPDDVVYVELSAEGAPSTVCTFRDELGAATVPAGTLAATSEGRFSLHRVRHQPFDASGVESGRVRFDFEVAVSVKFTE